MARVILQAGHYPAAGGAPGEAAWTWKLAHLIAPHLTALGVLLPVVGDFYGKAPPAALSQDADLFVALHYDGAVYGAGNNTGCFADRPANDPVAAQSYQAVMCWEEVYPPRVGIPLRNNRRNANTFNYYAFKSLTKRTPALLIEHGVGAPIPYGGYPAGQDASVLHNRIADVALADAHAIADYLRLTGALPPTPEEPEMTPDERSILDAAARQTAAGNTIANGGDLDWWIGTWQQLDRDKKDLARLLAVAQGERDQYMTKAGELEQQLQNATQPIATRITRVHVTATLEGGQTQELEGVPV